MPTTARDGELADTSTAAAGTDVADHAWHVEERELERHEVRRGRRHAFASLDPVRTALVVIDLVPFFVEASPFVRGIVPRVNRLATATRGAGGVVAWVVPGHTPPSTRDLEFFGPEVAEAYARSGGEGPPRTRVDPSLDVAGVDLVVEKTGRSAYIPGSSDLPDLLAARGVDHNATLHTVYRTYGDVRPTTDVLAMLGREART